MRLTSCCESVRTSPYSVSLSCKIAAVDSIAICSPSSALYQLKAPVRQDEAIELSS
jgi:hypothetical protein